jgi:hypothetical protein
MVVNVHGLSHDGLNLLNIGGRIRHWESSFNKSGLEKSENPENEQAKSIIGTLFQTALIEAGFPMSDPSSYVEQIQSIMAQAMNVDDHNELVQFDIPEEFMKEKEEEKKDEEEKDEDDDAEEVDEVEAEEKKEKESEKTEESEEKKEESEEATEEEKTEEKKAEEEAMEDEGVTPEEVNVEKTNMEL